MNFKRTHIPVLTLTAAALFAAWPSGLAKRTLLTNAVVHTVSGPTTRPVSSFWMATHQGRRPGGENAPVQKVDTINLKGQHISRNHRHNHCAWPDGNRGGPRHGNRHQRSRHLHPEVKSWLAINPDSELIPVARANGITHFLPPAGWHRVRSIRPAFHGRLGIREHAP